MLADKTFTQIISLPRSRTAWLSVALHGNGVDARHDMMQYGMSLDEYRANIAASPAPCAVDCSSALVARPSLIEDVDSQIIIIERTPFDSFASYRKHVGEKLAGQIWNKVQVWFDEVKKRFAERIVLTVAFDDLDASMAEIHKLVSPWPHTPAHDFKALAKLNIQEARPKWAGFLG